MTGREGYVGIVTKKRLEEGCNISQLRDSEYSYNTYNGLQAPSDGAQSVGIDVASGISEIPTVPTDHDMVPRLSYRSGFFRVLRDLYLETGD